MRTRRKIDGPKFTFGDLSRAWDAALAGSTVGERKIPVARSFESFSYRALEKQLEKQAKAKQRK